MSIANACRHGLSFLRRRYGQAVYSHRAWSSASSNVGYKVNSTLFDYSVKQVETIPELNISAVLLEHNTTKAEHLHLACEDPNNAFGVSFRTPAPNSTGVAHILEHLALCGSARYPCRDPFFNMLGRSLATFMNAFTAPDFTLYVFSSQNRKDFDNLLSVYLDATFFPSLLEKDFRQEGWRLEHENVNDKESPIALKGVVFNEMKGVFSDLNQCYARHLQNHLYPGTPYSHESGGDPLLIPRLSWEELRHFHARLYHPSNSRFITYGDMPLELHLEKIQDHVLGHFDSSEIRSDVPGVERWKEPKAMKIHNRFDPMAAAPDKQTIFSESFLLNRITDTNESFALALLGTLLVDGPNAPFYKKLLQSGIGPDYSPGTGFAGYLREGAFSVGLREIGADDVDATRQLISDTFDDVIRNGFPEEQIQSVLHRVELSTKHKTPNFAINCMMAACPLWNHGGDPLSALRVNEHVHRFTEERKRNPRFLQDKVAQYFKDNNHKLTLIMSPDENYEAKLQAKETELLKSKLSNVDDAGKIKIFEEGLELAEHQKHNDASCLPTLTLEDVQKTRDVTPLQFSNIGPVSVQMCAQPTHGLVHFRALADASDLEDDLLLLLPLFAEVVTQMGAGHRDYREFDREVQLRTGGLEVDMHVSEHPADPEFYEQGVLFSSYCLERNTKEMFSLWKDLFTAVRLDDPSRLTHLVRLRAAEVAQGVLHHGHHLATRGASGCLSRPAHVRERTGGMEQVVFMKRLAEMASHEEILQKLRQLSDTLLRKAFLRCSLNATPEFMPSALSALETFVGGMDLSQDTPVRRPSHEKTTFHPKSRRTHFVLPAAVNYLGRSVMTVPYAHPDFPSLKVAAKLMSSKYLHGEIREKGGAYGGGASVAKGGLYTFYSYRDPNVTNSLDSFSSSVDWILDGAYSDRDVIEAKLGVFGEVDAPSSPGSKGSTLFRDSIDHDTRQRMRDGVFSCTRERLRDVALRYLKNPSNSGNFLIGPLREEKLEDWTIEDNKL